jgi:hypothetical protein
MLIVIYKLQFDYMAPPSEYDWKTGNYNAFFKIFAIKVLLNCSAGLQDTPKKATRRHNVLTYEQVHAIICLANYCLRLLLIFSLSSSINTAGSVSDAGRWTCDGDNRKGKRYKRIWLHFRLLATRGDWVIAVADRICHAFRNLWIYT